jgi:hypothetical protein
LLDRYDRYEDVLGAVVRGRLDRFRIPNAVLLFLFAHRERGQPECGCECRPECDPAGARAVAPGPG